MPPRPKRTSAPWSSSHRWATEFAPQPDRQTIQGTVHKAVVMTVLFEDQGWQTLVTATAYIPPGKLTIGQMSELEEFCERLQAMEVAHER